MSALREQFSALVDQNLSPVARSAELAARAKSMVAGLIASGRASSVYVRYVDGREGAPEESVKGTGGGTILYRFSYQARVALFALEFLRQRSPSASGEFRESFYLGVDGRFVPAQSFNPNAVPPFAEITIGNTAAQSRKIDVQLDGSRPLRFSVPAGMFDDCVRAVKRQFGNVVQAKRVYTLNFPGQYTLRRGDKRGERVQSPAIVLAPIA